MIGSLAARRGRLFSTGRPPRDEGLDFICTRILCRWLSERHSAGISFNGKNDFYCEVAKRSDNSLRRNSPRCVGDQNNMSMLRYESTMKKGRVKGYWKGKRTIATSERLI